LKLLNQWRLPPSIQQARHQRQGIVAGQALCTKQIEDRLKAATKRRFWPMGRNGNFRPKADIQAGSFFCPSRSAGRLID
jgi:hypothetical protein